VRSIDQRPNLRHLSVALWQQQISCPCITAVQSLTVIHTAISFYCSHDTARQQQNSPHTQS